MFKMSIHHYQTPNTIIFHKEDVDSKVFIKPTFCGPSNIIELDLSFEQFTAVIWDLSKLLWLYRVIYPYSEWYIPGKSHFGLVSMQNKLVLITVNIPPWASSKRSKTEKMIQNRCTWPCITRVSYRNGSRY